MQEGQMTIWQRVERRALMLAVAGLVLLGLGFWLEGDVHFWGSLLANSSFFLFIAFAMLFFVAVHTIAHAGWHVALMRVPEAIGQYVVVGWGLLLISFLGFNALYHWSHPELHDPTSPFYDPHVAHKSAWLNLPFFVGRAILYMALWFIMARWLRHLSLRLGETGQLHYWKRLLVASGLFLVVFAITNALSAFDWIMSTDPHWYSTLFAWYLFSAYWVSGIAIVILIVLWLRKHGLHPHIRDEHLHDLGKYLFGFSIFWTYLWYSQYMLHWYANIPEETAWHLTRFHHHRVLFYLIIILNFAFPFFFLMSNSAKRTPWKLAVAALVVLIGHWLEFWLLVHPSIYHAHQLEAYTIGISDLGALFFTLGVFIFVVMYALRSAPLWPEKHPYFKESLTYKS